jgi:hypothetical protein
VTAPTCGRIRWRQVRAPAQAPIRQTACVLDRLRVAFVYIVAALLPLAGLLLAVVRYSQGERDESLRILLASFIGVCVYGLLLR